jgi:NAD(P)-dependent dehydrogenase (short-subunit alcohol dehydrogenase family)
MGQPRDRPVRTVLVTGANRGIGREVARQLLARGDRVVVTARQPDAAQRTAEQLGGDVIAATLDVTDRGSIDAVVSGLDRLDVVVNNAAIHYDTWQSAATADLAVVAEALDTNLLGAWRVVLATLPLLRRSPHPRIVNVSSESGSLAVMGAGPPAYQVSKAALDAFTITLAAELRGQGILVNAVCPGWVATDMGGRGGRPVADGAVSVIWAVDLPDDGPTGGFFRDGAPLQW